MPRPNGLEACSFGLGSGRVEPVLPLTLMEGTEGLTEIEGTEGVTEMEGAWIFGPRTRAGASLTEMLGMLGVTEMEGALTPRPLLGAVELVTVMLGMGGVTPIDGTLTFEPRPLPGPLTDKEGVSDTDIVGIGGAGDGGERAGAAW